MGLAKFKAQLLEIINSIRDQRFYFLWCRERMPQI